MADFMECTFSVAANNLGAITPKTPLGNSNRILSQAAISTSNRILHAPILAIIKPLPNTEFAITDEPEMPTIDAEATITGVNPDPTPNTVFEWTIQIRFTARVCRHGPNRQVNLDLIQTAQGGQFTPQFNQIRGGTLALIAKANVNGKQLEARVDGLKVIGTNPRRADVQAELGNDILRRIACHESSQRQFYTKTDGGRDACPLFSRDNLGGVGIMQITNPRPSDDEVWNWRSNIRRGREIFGQKQAAARRYPSQVRASRGYIDAVDRFNQKRKDKGLSPLRIVLPDFTPDQLELDTIRGFNGFAGRDQFGLPLHEYRVTMNGNELIIDNIDEEGKTGTLVWERVPAGQRPLQGDRNYVDNVLSHEPSC